MRKNKILDVTKTLLILICNKIRGRKIICSRGSPYDFSYSRPPFFSFLLQFCPLFCLFFGGRLQQLSLR